METIKNTVLALDELIAWIDESDYSDDVDPRLTPAEWQAAVDLAEMHVDIADKVAFLRGMPRNQVLRPDTY
jgi:hypothetical protein